jgi:hypothetical protein
MKKMTIVACAMVLPALSLTACGGDKKDSDKDQITSLIQSVDQEPAYLCTHMTSDYLQATFKGSVDTCKTAAKEAGNTGGKTTIKSITVSGGTAKAAITDKTGAATIEFAKTDGDWLVSNS